MISDKEPEVRSEAISKLPELAKYCSQSALVEKVLPILNVNTVTDTSQHVKSSLALSITEISKFIGKQNTLQFVVPPV